MSYISLARKYRPRRFVDLVGQEATTLALTNAIRLRREPHSVIFTGVRGVGKTTSARIYAKALNCEQGPTTDPCDQCASCLAIQNSCHEDVLEIDGASHTGVDDVRALQETLGYVPQRSAFKIYIIDEVHMLSVSAFNALLKTLEEPPEHVVFIFATTELQKVPETIQSRCQTFYLQKISQPLIVLRLEMILQTENVAFEKGVLALVAREGRGSLRDALTFLDQVIAVGGGAVNAEALRRLLGSSEVQPLYELLEALLQRDAAQALSHVAAWDQEGHELASLVEKLAKTCRDAFVLRDLKGSELNLQVLELEESERRQLAQIASAASAFDLNRLFRSCVKCLDDLRHADLDRYIVENYVLEWCLDPGLPDLQALIGRLGHGPSAVANSPLTQSGPVSTHQVQAPHPTPPGEPGMGLKDRWKQNQQAAALNSSKLAKSSPPLPSRELLPVPSSVSSPELSYTDGAAVPLQPIEAEPRIGAEVSGDEVVAALPIVTSPDLKSQASKAASPMSSALPPHLPSPSVSALVRAAPRNLSSAASRGRVHETKVRDGSSPPAEGPASSHTSGDLLVADSNLPTPPLVSSAGKEQTVSLAATIKEDQSPKSVIADLQKLSHEAQTQRSDPIAGAQSTIQKPAHLDEQSALSPILAGEKLKRLPATWREFVDAWKREKPLQARVVEETYVIEYGADRIRLAVDPMSMAGGKLLQADMRKRFMAQFEQLFGFQGQLEIVAKEDVKTTEENSARAPLGESLLEIKQKERELAREQLKQRLEDHPLTREAISTFGGTIEAIDFP